MGNRPIDELLAEAREVYGVFGKAERALSIVDRALGMDADNVEALNLKAAILYELDRDDESQAFHERALAIEPCSVEGWHGLAAIANDRAKYDEAVTLVEKGFASIPSDPHPEMRENEDYRQRLIAELYNEKAFALWYLGQKEDAVHLLTVAGPDACPLEVETFEDQLEWLEEHPHSPEA